MGKRLTESEKHERYKKERQKLNIKYDAKIKKSSDSHEMGKLLLEHERAVQQLQAKWFYTHKRGKIGK